MEAQQVWRLSVMSTWIFVLNFLSVCSGMGPPILRLESTVFVAFAGKGLDINCELEVPANQSSDILTCSYRNEQIYSCVIPETTHQPQNFKLKLELKNLIHSGEYSCHYNMAKVYWFLRVRSDDHWDLETVNDTEIYIVAFFTGVLLVFSVVGSVCVFRGHGKYCIIDCGDRKRKQSREERKEGEMEEDNVDAITAPSTSFYASLETRPGSIYDVLDHSAANGNPDQCQAKPKKKTPKKKTPEATTAQTTQDQHEGVFESVYENF